MKKNEKNLVYIAINGDDVGSSIGRAVAADDHEALSNASESIDQAHQSISEWVETMGGKTITSSGDEAIYSIPEAGLENLEEIRAKYNEMSGHTATIGIGSTMSEASKALIYGKLNNKDQIVEYSPEIEDAIGAEEDGQDPEAIEDELTEDDISEEGQDPYHEQDMEGEEEVLHDAAENEEDERDADIIESDEEGAEEGLNGRTDGQEAGLEDGLEEEMVEEELEGELEEEMIDDPEVEELDPEEQQMLDEEMEGPQEDYDQNDALSDMIYGQMEEGEQDPEMPEEEGDSELDDELRGDIAQALMVFKENKEALESAKEANPQLYEAVLVMLQSMIEMGKKLGYSPEADVAMQEAPAQLEDEFPGSEEEMEEEPMDQEIPIESEEDLIPEKKPKGKLE